MQIGVGVPLRGVTSGDGPPESLARDLVLSVHELRVSGSSILIP